MSSDSEFEPTPPKQRCFTRSLSINENSASPSVRSVRSGQCNNIESDNEVFILSDGEIGRTSQTASIGNKTLAVRSNSESPPVVTLDTSVQCETVPGTSKRTAEMRDTEATIDSDSSDSEKCPICWLPYTNQEVATPTTCDHRFCFHCIVEWSRTMNTCPVDRQVFSSIIVRPKFGSNVTRLVPIETQVRADTDEDTEEHDLDDNDDDDDDADHERYAGVLAYQIAEEEYIQDLYDSVERYERTNATTETSVDTTSSTEEDVNRLDAIRIALQFSSTDDDGDDDDGGSGSDVDGRDDSGENADVMIVSVSSSSSDEERPDVVFSSQYNDWTSSSAASSLASPNVSNSSPPPSPSPYISLSSSSSFSSSPSTPCSASPVSLSSPAISPSPAPSPSPSPSPLSSSGSLSDFRSLSPATSSSASY